MYLCQPFSERLNKLKKMKKILSIITFIIAISLLSATAIFVCAATDKPSYELADQTVERGGSFSVVISLKNNPGIISLRFNVGYDESLLRLNSIEDLGLLEGYTPPSPDIGSPYTLRWINSLWTDTSSPGSTASGELVRLNFTAISESDAVTEVTVSHIEANNSKGVIKSPFENDKAKIEIKNKYTVKFLSEDGSGVISEQKYFLGESVVLPEDPTRAPDGVNKYTFNGWSPEVVTTVEGDATYSATFTAELLETDSTLKSLSAQGVILDPEFDPSVTEYSAVVDFSVTTIDLAVETTGALASFTIEGTELSVGENTVKITVSAENGEITVYTVTVTRQEDPTYVEDNDSTLGEVIPSFGILSPSFSSDKTDYILYVSSSTESVSFTCTASSQKAREFSSDEPHIIENDRAVITLFCVAENGERTEYTVTVVMLPEYNGEIPEFVFGTGEDEGDGDPLGPPVTEGPATDDGQTEKIPETTVIIIIAAASFCALASVIGIIILLISNRKNKKNKT